MKKQQEFDQELINCYERIKILQSIIDRLNKDIQKMRRPEGADPMCPICYINEAEHISTGMCGLCHEEA